MAKKILKNGRLGCDTDPFSYNYWALNSSADGFLHKGIDGSSVYIFFHLSWWRCHSLGRKYFTSITRLCKHSSTFLCKQYSRNIFIDRRLVYLFRFLEYCSIIMTWLIFVRLTASLSLSVACLALELVSLFIGFTLFRTSINVLCM